MPSFVFIINSKPTCGLTQCFYSINFFPSSLCFSLAQEYVDLYKDWLLNKSIAKQFDAFKKGFDLVMKDKHLADLFTAEEVEMLVCGSKVSGALNRIRVTLIKLRDIE